MASDPEQLPDAAPPQNLPYKPNPQSTAYPFSNNSAYSSPYATNPAFLRPPDQPRSDVPQPQYGQPDFKNDVQSRPYPHTAPPYQTSPYPASPYQASSYPSLSPQNPTTQSLGQFQSPSRTESFVGQMTPPKKEYKSPYASEPQESSRAPSSRNITPYFQHTVPGYGNQDRYPCTSTLQESSRIPLNTNTSPSLRYSPIPRDGCQDQFQYPSALQESSMVPPNINATSSSQYAISGNGNQDQYSYTSTLQESSRVPPNMNTAPSLQYSSVPRDGFQDQSRNPSALQESSMVPPNVDAIFPPQYTVPGNGYHNQSLYISTLQESLRASPDVNVTFSSQHITIPQNEYQTHQILHQEGFAVPSRNAVDESEATRLEIGEFSSEFGSYQAKKGEDQAIDNITGGILKKKLITEGLDNEMTINQDDEDNPTESESLGEQEREEDDGEDESDFLDESDAMSRDEDELSDTDTVAQAINEQKRNYINEVQKFRSTRKDSRSRKKHKRVSTAEFKRKKVVHKGPRKIAELTGDIKLKLTQANQSFFQDNYEEARKEAQDIIRVNAEVWQAWSLLALIFREWGQFDEEMLAMTSCCHFMPKEESGNSWLTLARRIDDADDESRQKHLADGAYCCSAALKILKKNVEALCLKGGFNREMSRMKSAIGDYEVALRVDPHNPIAMRGLALCYLDEEKPELAKKIYEEAITFYQQSGLSESRFSWNEIAIYIELFGSAGEYAEAIKHSKLLSRWLLGREGETYWDDVIKDDREWDTNDLRRNEVISYQGDKYDMLTYGDGLPLELRTKLGIYRLKLGDFHEAMTHFSYLEAEGNFGDDEGVASLADLFHEVGDTLFKAEYYEDALTFYKILEGRVPDDEDFSHYFRMGTCYIKIDGPLEAEQSFLKALDHDEDSIAVRQELVKLYSDTDSDEAAKYRQEIKDLVKKSGRKYKLGEIQVENRTTKAFIERKERKSYQGKRKSLTENWSAEQKEAEEIRIAGLLQSYETIQRCNEGLKAGDVEATAEWMGAAADLVADFRTCKGLYPYDKYYYGKSLKEKEKAIQAENERAALDDDDVSQEGAAARMAQTGARKRPAMPTDHLGLSWALWLDILVQYALCLSKEQKYLDAYDVCISAKEAIVYCHNQESMFTIYLCWCTCAVLANDMDTITSQMRHFMKEYQFTTDAYRLCATLIRLCQSPLSHLTKGPTTKFILRNIKTMDFSLLGDVRGHDEFSGRTSYSARDANGKLVVNTEMDICLLLLYGHILYVNTSFGKALHYLFRAYSLDPGNSMINMSVGLCYIQYAIKRQTHYRPHVIMQGISFMQNYYENARKAPRLEEREEAHYNMARTYHMLGLNHLAIPFYIKVFREAEGSGRKPGRDDLVVDAAYNLQTLYTLAGNARLAKAVTDRWLVI